MDPGYATLLSSPLSDGWCISRVIGGKIAVLNRLRERFVALSAHDAFILLRHLFVILKLQYLLPVALCYQSEALVEYENTLRPIMVEVTITTVASDDKASKQASLPVNLGRLGVCSLLVVESSAYLASLCVTSVLVEAILLATFPSSKPCLLDVLNALFRGSYLSTFCGCW